MIPMIMLLFWKYVTKQIKWEKKVERKALAATAIFVLSKKSYSKVTYQKKEILF